MVLVVLGSYIYFFTQDGNTGFTASNSPGAPTATTTAPSGGPTSGKATVGKGGARPAGSAFVHRATSENISSNSTYLDSPLVNNNPKAIIFVTQNWNPGGKAGVYNDHPVGVWYDSNARRWAVFNQDRAAMPEGAAFNILIMKGEK